jgi:hypothetical protein
MVNDNSYQQIAISLIADIISKGHRLISDDGMVGKEASFYYAYETDIHRIGHVVYSGVNKEKAAAKYVEIVGLQTALNKISEWHQRDIPVVERKEVDTDIVEVSKAITIAR